MEDILELPLTRRGYNPGLGHVFAQGLVGLVAAAGQSWLDERQVPKEELAAQLVNLAWNGLSNLQKEPRLVSVEKDARAAKVAASRQSDVIGSAD